jgi:hypothetical protein
VRSVYETAIADFGNSRADSPHAAELDFLYDVLVQRTRQRESARTTAPDLFLSRGIG